MSSLSVFRVIDQNMQNFVLINKAKKKNCCIGVTRPTLILPPTLDIFIYLFIYFFFWGEKIKIKALSWILR